MRLTDKRMREIEARAGKATKGPWEAKRIDHAPKRVEHYVDLRNEDDLFHEASGITYNRYVLPTDEQALHDVEFVAHARTDIPTLLADRAALLTENAKLRKVVEAAHQLTTATVWKMAAEMDSWKSMENAARDAVYQHFKKLTQALDALDTKDATEKEHGDG